MCCLSSKHVLTHCETRLEMTCNTICSVYRPVVGTRLEVLECLRVCKLWKLYFWLGGRQNSRVVSKNKTLGMKLLTRILQIHNTIRK